MAQKPTPAKKPFQETPVYYDALKEAGLTERQFKEQTGRPEMPEELKDIKLTPTTATQAYRQGANW